MATYEPQDVYTSMRTTSVIDKAHVSKNATPPIAAEVVSRPAGAAVITNGVLTQMGTSSIVDRALIDIYAGPVV